MSLLDRSQLTFISHQAHCKRALRKLGNLPASQKFEQSSSAIDIIPHSMGTDVSERETAVLGRVYKVEMSSRHLRPF